MNHIAFTFLSALRFLPLIAGSISVDPFLGVAPQEEKYYKSSGDVIKCRDGFKSFNTSQLNDDFCDCADGSDEPGTSACPNGKFYCRNVGHVPITLYSSRVNDGICDCCDGSDEYDGLVKCKNTCWEAGKVARDKLQKKIGTYREGVTIRKYEIEKAKLSIANDEAELSKLKSEEEILKGLVQQLKDRKEQIEKVEEEERLLKEKEEEEEEEEEAKKKLQKESDIEKTKTLEDFAEEKENPADTKDEIDIGLVEKDTNAHLDLPEDNAPTPEKEKYEDTVKVDLQEVSETQGSLYNEEKRHDAGDHHVDSSNEDLLIDIKKDKDQSESLEELSKEELGRRVASRWTGESTEHQAEVAHEENIDDHDKTIEDTEDEEYGYDSETDDDREKYADNAAEDHTDEDFREEDSGDSGSSYTYDSDDESHSSDSPSWLEKIQQTVHSIIQAVSLFKNPVNISDAVNVRKEYESSNAKLSKIKSRISSLTKKLKQDFGPEKEFFSFHGRCFESKQNKYVYKICPYKQATQEEGHSSTRLGTWDKFDDSYRTIVFSNGDKCWNGPDRSIKVKLRCGLSNEVTDVDEPSRCEYVAILSTPAICHEEKLKELEEMLDQLNKQQPQSHDEL